MRMFAVAFIPLTVGVLGFPSARADTKDLYGNTLICTVSSHTITIHIRKERVFAYHSYRGTPSKEGTIYEFGRERTGMAGVNSYQSSARVDSNQVELSQTVVNRSCTICDGKTIMQSDVIRVTGQGSSWAAVRDFKQWFPDGTAAAVPSGTERYTCKLVKGRVGVGG